jgi:hypothetical protein
LISLPIAILARFLLILWQADVFDSGSSPTGTPPGSEKEQNEMSKFIGRAGIAGILAMFVGVSAQATIIGVAGPASSAGTAPAIIAAPLHALDDIVTNTGMEGFDEAQSVLTSVPHVIDGGGFIPVNSLVDSHMIFLNSAGSGSLSHFDVVYTFDGPIIGVMSDTGGAFEAASTFELGNPATNYTVTFVGSGPAAPFGARGIEGNTSPSGPFPNDGYLISADFMSITVGMSVSEPGDWIRVVTRPVPEPGTVLLMSLGLFGLGLAGSRRRRS